MSPTEWGAGFSFRARSKDRTRTVCRLGGDALMAEKKKAPEFPPEPSVVTLPGFEPEFVP